MILLRTASATQTQEAAAVLAELAEGGDVILLAGDLGAGKTTFTQGFGRALGITDPITSPTFTLARQYQGRLMLHHLDVYRFDSNLEVFDVGLAELIDDRASVTVIEWGDAIRTELPLAVLEIELRLGDDDDERHISLRFTGLDWQKRQPNYVAALAPWIVEGDQ